MNRREYILQRMFKINNDMPQSEAILDMLIEEGVAHLGYGDREVDAIIEAFKATYGTTKASKYDRWAANRLCGRYGSQAIVGIIKLLGEHSQDKYCPVVNSVSELEDKFVSVMSFLRGIKSDETIDV